MLGHLADEKELISLFKNLQEQTNNFTFNSLTLYGNKSSSDNTTVFVKKDPDQIIEITTSS